MDKPGGYVGSRDQSYKEGWQDGFDDGYEQGYQDGEILGYENGMDDCADTDTERNKL